MDRGVMTAPAPAIPGSIPWESSESRRLPAPGTFPGHRGCRNGVAQTGVGRESHDDLRSPRLIERPVRLELLELVGDGREQPVHSVKPRSGCMDLGSPTVGRHRLDVANLAAADSHIIIERSFFPWRSIPGRSREGWPPPRPFEPWRAIPGSPTDPPSSGRTCTRQPDRSSRGRSIRSLAAD